MTEEPEGAFIPWHMLSRQQRKWKANRDREASEAPKIDERWDRFRDGPVMWSDLKAVILDLNRRLEEIESFLVISKTSGR